MRNNNKIANLYLEDFFAWGVWQKIRLTGNRELTLAEIENYAYEIGNKARKLGFRFTTNFSRDLTLQFLQEYKNFISYTENTKGINTIKLKEGISYEASLEIFPMGSMSYELIDILMDENISNKVFIKENNKSIGC